MSGINWDMLGVIFAAVVASGGFIAWLVKIALDVGSIKGLLLARLKAAEARLSRAELRWENHERRINKLESQRRDDA